MRRDRRDRSDGIDADDEGDRKKMTKISPKNTNDQNVSFAREECHLSLWIDFSILNFPGVDGMLSMWDICFICDTFSGKSVIFCLGLILLENLWVRVWGAFS